MKLLPNDLDSHYTCCKLVPHDHLDDIKCAKIITNYHAFKLREHVEFSKDSRAMLQGRTGGDLQTTENDGQIIQRVISELMGLKNILILNDEAHHCYREKPSEHCSTWRAPVITCLKLEKYFPWNGVLLKTGWTIASLDKLYRLLPF